MKRWCRSTPRRGTIDASQVPTRATCVCGRSITLVDGLINQASYWRHNPKPRTMR